MKNKVVVYQGVEGAYSHLSCNTVFPNSILQPSKSFHEAMQLVEQDKADFAMIPIENTSAGRVEEIYRLIPNMQLHIIKEHFQIINHALLSVKGNSIENLKYVSSHPQALAQCANNIKRLNLEPIAKFDTAGAAKELLEFQDNSHAVIASTLAAEIYGLDILDDSFMDHKGNVTRFLILSKNSAIPEYDPKKRYITSLIFYVKNIPAALYKALGGFATNGIDLIKIESYSPLGSVYSAQFHIDLYGHTDNQNLKNALDELSYFSEGLKVIGVYERDPHRDTMGMV